MGRRCAAAGVNSAPRAPGRAAHSALVVSITPRRGDAPFFEGGEEERGGEEGRRGEVSSRTEDRRPFAAGTRRHKEVGESERKRMSAFQKLLILLAVGCM